MTAPLRWAHLDKWWLGARIVMFIAYVPALFVVLVVLSIAGLVLSGHRLGIAMH
jgi:hypothetical protein